MKKYQKALLAAGAGALAMSVAIGAIGLFVTVAESIGLGNGMPSIYFQYLRLPYLSVLLPVVGIIALLAVLPAFLKENEVSEIVEAPPAQGIDHERHLRAA